MCAISGCVGLPIEETCMHAMLQTMARRGPDDRGIFRNADCTLLHTRLAIIDPTGGAQPMELLWGGEHYCITYNGELYNTEQLRKKLEKLGHAFATHSDTEVVLHSYAQWGPECLLKMNGIFAFGIWESKKRRMFLARDRIGVKPLFYSLSGEGLLFASEIKTILVHPSQRAALDAEGAAQILLLGPGRQPGSGVFRGIRELEPGCWATFEGGTLAIHRYWSLKDREHRENFRQTAEHTRALVLDAITRQMVSDVPIGTFLSGGLDSSLISAVCAKKMEQAGRQLMTFSVGYPENDKYFRAGKFQPTSDSDFIGLMEEFLHSDHHLTELPPETLVSSLEEATVARDLPGMADVDFSLLAFCREIRKYVKVALSGECADEIFGGYPWYRDPEVRDRAGFPWAQNTIDRCNLLHPDLRAKLDGEAYVMEAYLKTCRESDILPGCSPRERRMKEMVNLNFRWFMQTLLDRKDRMSMFSGLEVRVPFCDYRIAEYLYGVPWEYKDYQGEEKGLLRYACGDLLPEAVAHRKKSPYPKTFDPRYETLLEEKMQAVLSADSPLFALVDREALKMVLDSQSPWPWYGQLMARPQKIAYFLQIDFWLRHYGIELQF
jgi:asparagine synthase (glutamine-hydrolysing)